MAVTQNVMMERGLLRVVARTLPHDNDEIRAGSVSYDVEIKGQEVLHSFPSLDEATQFVNMVAPDGDR